MWGRHQMEFVGRNSQNKREDQEGGTYYDEMEETER